MKMKKKKKKKRERERKKGKQRERERGKAATAGGRAKCLRIFGLQTKGELQHEKKREETWVVGKKKGKCRCAA